MELSSIIRLTVSELERGTRVVITAGSRDHGSHQVIRNTRGVDVGDEGAVGGCPPDCRGSRGFAVVGG